MQTNILEVARMKRIIVISGFSGVGKGSVIKKLLENNTDVWLSVSDTDREKRNDTDRYTFLTSEEFQSNLKNGEYIEYNRYGNHFYGSPRKPILEKIRSDCTVLLEIDVWGKRQLEQDIDLKRLNTEIISVFILAEANELNSRLHGRGDSGEEIRKRLKIVMDESGCIEEYDFVLINHEVQDTMKKLQNIIQGRPVDSDMFDTDKFQKEIATLIEMDEGTLK